MDRIIAMPVSAGRRLHPTNANRVGVGAIAISPSASYLPEAFSTCPPNWKRIADSNLSWKSASPREVKRSYSAVVSTGAGTASSIAALIVQRPSPESETRPANFARRDLRPGPPRSGPAATRRSRCRAATPRRCRAG